MGQMKTIKAHSAGPVRGIILFPLILMVLIPFSCKKDDTGKPSGKTNDLVKYDPVVVEKTCTIATYVHYMPWFETNATSADGNWGQHWTMATQNPEIVDDTGRRQIASYFYPLGPYASGDRDVIEYHLLLMKYSGIDGILFDWYGTLDLYDYPAIKKNVEAMIDMLDKVGLKFAIVYEDRTVQAALDAGFITDGIAAAQADMDYIASNYFSYDNYIRVDGKPLLLVFGPVEFHQGSQWTQI